MRHMNDNTFEHKGYQYEINQDNFSDPRHDFEQLTTLICWHNRWQLGDKHDYATGNDFLLGLVEDELPASNDFWKPIVQNLTETDKAVRESLEEYAEDEDETYEKSDNYYQEFLLHNYVYSHLSDAHQIKNTLHVLYEVLKKYVAILPVYLYEHGGITMNTTGFSDRWDSGQVGHCYVSHQKILEIWPELRGDEEKLKQKAKEVIEQEVATYDQYLRGDVWVINITKVTKCQCQCQCQCQCEHEHEHEHIEDIESLSGIYGADAAHQEAQAIIDAKTKD